MFGGCEPGGVEESLSDGIPNNTDQLVVSSSQEKFMLSHPRSVEQVVQPSFTDDTYMRGGKEISVNTQISEAWLNGYRKGVGFSAQVFCWGCNRYGYIVPFHANF